MINYKSSPENKETLNLIGLILKKTIEEEELNLKSESDKLEESRSRGRLKGTTLTFRLSERLLKGDNPKEVIKQFEFAFNSSNRTLIELELKYADSQESYLKYEIAYHDALSSTLEVLKDSINSSLR